MDKEIERILENNKDVVEFIADLLSGEPDMSTRDVKLEIYKKFGIERFASKQIITLMLVHAGREKVTNSV